MNWIINYTIIFNTAIISKYGFKATDKVFVIFSKQDTCFYVTKNNLGDNKLCRDSNVLKTRNKNVTQKLGAILNERLYFTITQDKHDKLNNSIKCIIKIKENE